MLTFISLFSGIGGMDLGLEWVGMRCVAQVEIDDYATRVLQKHWPDVPRHRDVRDVGRHNLPSADVVAGGFPCQPFSVAGRRHGEADDRNLWPEMRRVIDEIRPVYVIGENVPNLIGIYLDTVIADLEASNYTVGAITLPAAACDAPHIRERVFVLAYTEKPRLQNGGQARVRPSTAQSNTMGTGPERLCRARWIPEPGVGRVAYGVPHRVDRIRGLGNAVVPQVAAHIGSIIVEHHKQISGV